MPSLIRHTRRTVHRIELPLLLLVAGSLVGLAYVLGKKAGTLGVPPAGFAFWQAVGGWLALTVIAKARGVRIPLDAQHLRYYLIAGLLGFSLPSLAAYTVLVHLPAGVVTPLVTLSPLLTYLLAGLLGQEPFQRRRLLGIALGFAGVLVLAVMRPSAGGEVALGWLLLGLMVPASLASGNIYRSRAWPVGSAPLALAAGMLLIQVPLLGVLHAASGDFYVPLPGRSASLIVWGQMVLAALTYLATFQLQHRGGAVYLSQMGYVVTLTGVVLGVLWFGEQPGVGLALAVALMFIGIALTTRATAPAAGSARGASPAGTPAAACPAR